MWSQSNNHVDINLKELTQLFAQADRILCITGAGVSVASGINPFRKSKDAEWEVNVTSLATLQFFKMDPKL